MTLSRSWNIDVWLFFDSQCQTWHGNCFVSLFKRDWNCWSSSFNLNFGFNFVFCIGITAVKSSLILTLIFLLIGHFRFFMAHFCVSLQRDWNCVGKQFHLNFGLVYLILFLDEHSPLHLQLIFYFVANLFQRSNLLLIDCCRSQHLEQQISFILFLFLDGYVRPIHCTLLPVLL